MKKGFTMIELIFVIVILGILAAVAIPRLAATRDDAQVAKALSEVSTVISDFGTYYTSQGKWSVTASDMTNVADINTSDNNISDGAVFTYYTPDNAGDMVTCVDINVTPDGNLTVSANNGGGNICDGVVGSNAFADLNGTKTFGGKRVNF